MKKCSNVEHQETNAVSYCSECRIYMCNKCEKSHSDLFKNNHQNKIIKDLKDDEFFSGICPEENHLNELIYYCRNHNKLCCTECITKIKDKNNGKHKDCDVCPIKEIENAKKSKIKRKH